MITRQRRNLLFLSLPLIPISLPFLVSCKSNSTPINWYGIRSVKMFVNENNENQQKQKRIEIRIIVDNRITYDKDKTNIEFIKPNGDKIDSSKFEIILSEDRHEITLYYNDVDMFTKGIYKLKINSNQVVQINFQNDVIDPSQKQPDILYLEEFNKKYMYLDLIGKNFKSIGIEQISIENLKNRKKLTPNIDFYLTSSEDENIRLSFNQTFDEGTYKIELGNTTAWFDYKKSSGQNDLISLISVEIQDDKTIKLHGRNLSKVLSKQILVENMDDLSQLSIDKIKEIQNTFIILELKSPLPGNVKIKISISKEDYIEFRYGTIISKAAMKRVQENEKDIINIEFEGENLSFIKNNKEDYSFVFLNVSTNITTPIYNFNIEENQENNKLSISILDPQIGSGNFEIYLSYKNSSFISMTRSSLLEPLKPNIISANTLLDEDKKRKIYLLIDSVANGDSINENLEVEIECKTNSNEKYTFTNVLLNNESYKNWNYYLFLEEDSSKNFTDPFSKKNIKIFWKQDKNSSNKIEIYNGEINGFL